MRVEVIQIEYGVQALQSSKWEGKGSVAFFTEMERFVFLNRRKQTEC